MNFGQIYNEAAALRFNTQGATIAQIKNWVNKREADVWAAASWPWKDVAPTTVALTANNEQVAAGNMPSGFRRPIELFNDLGDLVPFVEEDDFWPIHLASSQKARPGLFTVLNGVIYLDPTPDQAYNYKLSYRRALAHRDLNGGIVAGSMSADTDQPIFPSDYHYMLVDGAVAAGKRLRGDPTWQDDEAAFSDALKRLIGEVVSSDRATGGRAYAARDPL